MKSTKLNNKLQLGKKTIAKLDLNAMDSINGGGTSTSCNIVINVSNTYVGGSVVIKF